MHLFVVAFLLNAISMALIDEKNIKQMATGKGLFRRLLLIKEKPL
jgi:hypothetical protein